MNKGKGYPPDVDHACGVLSFAPNRREFFGTTGPQPGEFRNAVSAEVGRCRNGAPWTSQLVLVALLAWLMMTLISIVGDVHFWMLQRIEVLLTVGGIACWRWSWFLIQNVRAILYRYFTYPRLRRAAARAVQQFGPVPEVIILATTYHEKPWITAVVFESVFRELRAVTGLQCRPKVVVVTGCDEDDQNIQEVFARCCTSPEDQANDLWPPELILRRGENGKREALGKGMEEIAQGNPHDDGVVVFMDADTLLQPGMLAKVLPLFRLQPAVGAVTTNENGWVKGPTWFAEWISLRFGLRHRTMCSVALSGRLLCLTGRLSVFRATAIKDASFRNLVRQDLISNWLWGSFEMLSGDDKTTWFWMAAHQQRMLYVPDAMVTTIEVVQGSAVQRALANIRRWSGNSVRHSWRAIKLGPRKLGLFPWWSLVDQRLAMGTVLVGPCLLLLALCAGRYEVAAGYLLWVLTSRLTHAAVAWRQGRRFSAYYVPLQIVSDWATALTKFWVLFHPAKQSWLNRGARKLNAVRGSAFYGLRTGFAHYLYLFTTTALLIVVGVFVGFLPVFREARLFLNPRARTTTFEVGTSHSMTNDPAEFGQTIATPDREPVTTRRLPEPLVPTLLEAAAERRPDPLSEPPTDLQQLIFRSLTNYQLAYENASTRTELYQQSFKLPTDSLMLKLRKAMPPVRKDANSDQAKSLRHLLHESSKR